MHPRHLVRKKLLTKSNIQAYVREALLPRTPTPAELRVVFDNSKSIPFRVLWVLILIQCFIVCCYQTGERVRYYISKPTAVYTSVEEKDHVDLPQFFIGNIDTPQFDPYWRDNKKRQPEKIPVSCCNPVRALLRSSRLARDDPVKLWRAANMTPSIRSLYVEYNERKISYVNFVNGTVNDSHNLDHFRWTERESCTGMATVINMSVPIRVGSRLHLVAENVGTCNDNQLPGCAIDHVIPFHYHMFNRFGSDVQIAFSIREFHAISRGGNCEEDSQKLKQCYYNCLVKEYLKIKCWLPFMPQESNLNNQTCLTANDEAGVLIYAQAQKVFIDTSPTFDCFCKKLCVQTTVQIHTQKQTDVTNRLSIQYYPKDPFVVIFKEKYVYDVIGLLIDIGGNLGLYLGWSILSIAQYGQFISNALRDIFKPKRRNSRREQERERFNDNVRKIATNVLITESDKHRMELSFRSNILKVIIVVLSCMLSIYISAQLILLWLRTPVRTILEVHENKTMYHPNMIFCGEHGKITMMKKRIVKKTDGKKLCDVDFLDLLDKEKLSVEELWKKMVTFHDNGLLHTVIGLLGVNTSYDQTMTAMPGGQCVEFMFEPHKYIGESSSYFFCFIPHEGRSSCNEGIKTFYIRPLHASIHSVYTSARLFSPNFPIRIVIRTFNINRLNVSGRVCGKEDEFEKCKTDCYETKMKNSLKCRLPFMENINMNWCENTTTAKDARNKYYEIVLKTNVQNECRCITPCNETIYQTFVYFDEPSEPNIHLFSTLPLSNLIETVREVLSYTLITLICDIANSFALTIGLSLLTGFKYVHNIVIYLRNQTKNAKSA